MGVEKVIGKVEAEDFEGCAVLFEGRLVPMEVLEAVVACCGPDEPPAIALREVQRLRAAGADPGVLFDGRGLLVVESSAIVRTAVVDEQGMSHPVH